MFAFIIGNVWASHDAEIRDLRGQYSVLLPLKGELQALEVRAKKSMDYPPMPCSGGFESASASDMTQWRSIRQEDRYYLLADWNFYQKLNKMYHEVETEVSIAARADTITDCQSVWSQFAKNLTVFNAEMNGHLNDLQDQYAAGPWYRWPISRIHVRILLYTLVALVVVLALPVLLRLGARPLRRGLGLVPADDATITAEGALGGGSSINAAATRDGPSVGLSGPASSIEVDEAPPPASAGQEGSLHTRPWR
jgi:hypothetical protein